MTLSTGATGYGVAHAGSDLGKAPRDGGPRVMTLKIDIRGSSATDLPTKLNTLKLLLKRAQETRAQGMGRLVTLTVTPNGGNAVTWQVLGGDIAQRAEPFHPRRAIGFRSGWFTLQVIVEPYGRGSSTTLTTASTLSNTPGITNMYVHHTGGTSFSVNMVGLIEGSFWQSDKLTTSPTLKTPAASDALYFGRSVQFSELEFGLKTAASGITWTGWQYYNGAAWTTLTMTTNTFKTSAELDTVQHLGRLAWTAPADWATQTVNGISQYWVRLLVSSVSSPTAPVRINGPVRAHVRDYSDAGTSVAGDVDADALVHLTTSTAAVSVAGHYTAVATGLLSSYSPPFVVPFVASDRSVVSGDSSAAVASDTECIFGERVTLTVLSSFTERGQTFNGSDEYAARTGDATSAEYLTVYQSAFRMGVWLKLSAKPTRPVPLVSQWTSSSSTQSFWFGIDPTDAEGNGQVQLRLLVRHADNDKRTLNGTTALETNRWYWAAWDWTGDGGDIRLYLDGKLEGRTHSHDAPRQQATSTTAWRIGSSVSWNTADSRDGSSAEGFLNGTLGEVVLWDDDFDSIGGPSLPTSATVDGSTVALLLKMEDNLATAALVDSATTRGATAYNFTRNGASTNTSAHTTAGPFSTGATPTKVLGIRLPQTYGEEYAGRYKVLLAARPSATLTDTEQFTFYGQVGVGDASLPMIGPGAQFPDTTSPTGYYILDLGTITLPAFRMYDGHRSASTSSARNSLDFYLFVASTVTSSTAVHLDNLYFMPLDTWYGHYRTFRDGDSYDTTYTIDQNEGLLIDGTSPELTVSQTDTNGYTVQMINPFGQYQGNRPRLKPGRPFWLFDLNLLGAAHSGADGRDYLERRVTSGITTVALRLHSVPRWDELAAA